MVIEVYMHSIPTLKEFDALLPDNIAFYQYLVLHNVFYMEMDCECCGLPMKWCEASFRFQCNRAACPRRGSRISINRGTFFYGSNLNYLDIMKLGLLWLAKVSVDSALALTCHSEHTVCNFYRHFRQLTSSALKEEDTPIGGPGITVEIDETKLGKRKYHRGYRVDGVWVLVGIEKLPRGKI